MNEFSKRIYLIVKLTLVAFGIIVIFTTFIKTEHYANSVSLEAAEKIAEIRNTKYIQSVNILDSQVTENSGEYDVIQLQTRLKQKGYYPGAIDGIYGEQTQDAVYNFQISLGLEATAIVDEKTWTLLQGNTNSFPQKSSSVKLLSPDIQKIVDRGELIVVMTEYDNSPFFVENKRGELEGLDIKIARGLAEALGVELQINRSAKTFNEVVEFVDRGQADLAISKLSQTLNRAKIISFSHPYLTMRQGLLLNRIQLTKAAKNKETVEFLRDFEGKIGVINGSSYEGFAKQKFPKATIVTYPSWEEVVKGAIRGDILAAYRDELEVKKIVINQPNVALNFQTVALTDTQDPIAIALPWSSNHLLEFVNLYLQITNNHYSVKSLLDEYSELLETSSADKFN
ncbi:MAG: transporter substrate-binding domain-containing protein [Okeania sp. SIO2C9]|uniref:transporter substrate-binding domain-containing protein n=1 Tax=Okeania sp. SIO2C9 TaxID=2607791 RepID=UPI0013C1A9F5|nr:transporter substrate-binding domain-containing protein [Okeania sp. SIO2C9]NEQ71807.1 transporter substrate-binding domain-containing protein [Okeania sp. SIO2C9]